MTIVSGLILLVALLFVVLVFWGLFTRCQFRFVGVLAILSVPVAALGAWYSWMETQSVGWTIGYSAFAMIGIVTAIRHLGRRKVASAS